MYVNSGTDVFNRFSWLTMVAPDLVHLNDLESSLCSSMYRLVAAALDVEAVECEFVPS